MADWKIHRKDESCTRCERTFEEGEALFSVLRISGEGLSRDDLCRTCFPAGEDEGTGEDLIWWRTRRRPQARRGLAVDFEAVEGLFLALGGREEEQLRELRYLLALLLMRKRRLKLIRVKRRADGELMIVRRPRRKEELEVFVFDLTPERAEELRGQLEGLFEGAGIEDVLAQGSPSGGGVPEDAAEAPEEESGDLADVAEAPPEEGREAPAEGAAAAAAEPSPAEPGGGFPPVTAENRVPRPKFTRAGSEALHTATPNI